MVVNVEIFGVEGYVHDVLKAHLIAKLDQAGIQYRLHDFVQIEDFITEGLESVPAVRVNHKRRFTKTDASSIEQFAQKVCNYILDQAIQTVICPIDFSEHSLNAARWALGLANSSGMRLKLVHVFLPVPEIQYSTPVDLQSQVGGLEQKLEQVRDDLATASPGIPIHLEVEVGDPVHTITQYSKNARTGFIVLGTHGSSNIIRKFFGSISGRVARHAQCPVILVPPDLSFTAPKRILVAFEHELLSNGQVKSIQNMNETWKAQVDFLHIHHGGDEFSAMKDRLAERLTTEVPGFAFEIHEMESGSGSVIETLVDYGSRTQPDLVVLVTRYRNLFQRLLQPGTTKKLHDRTKWPLLVLHAA